MAPNQGWLRGIVKEVVSGDTLVIAGAAPRGTVPPEKRITLSSVIAPRLVSHTRMIVTTRRTSISTLTAGPCSLLTGTKRWLND